MKFILIILSLFSHQAIASKNCTKKEVSDLIYSYKTFKDNKKINKFFTKEIIKSGKKHNVNCLIMASILKIESDFIFKTNKITPNDISIAQINFPLQLVNLRNEGYLLDKKKLMKSNKYAIDRLAVILKLLKKNNPKDPLWFTRYYSGYYIHKLTYLHRLEYQCKKVGLADYFVNYKEKNRLLNHCIKKYGAKKVLNIYTRLDSKANEYKEFKKKIDFWKNKRIELAKK